MGTAVADEEEAFQMHVEDSLALLPTLDTVASQHAHNLGIEGRLENAEFSLIDVGSGGGLPGVIIAIARPNWKVVVSVAILSLLCCLTLQAVPCWGTRAYVNAYTNLCKHQHLSCSANFASTRAIS